MAESTALVTFTRELEGKMAPQFERVLPPHLPVQRLVRTIRNAVMLNPKLLQAERSSLWDACMTSAVLGLEPDPAMGQGYMVPFKGKVQFIPGYRGLITLCYNAGFVVQGVIVRTEDQFEYEYGLEPRLIHRPSRSHKRGNDNPITGAYATARHASDPSVFEVMEAPDIIRVRDRSAGYQYALKQKNEGKKYDNPWFSDFEAMARKSPIRRLCEHLPMNVQKANAIEDAYDRGEIINAQQGPDGKPELVREEPPAPPPMKDVTPQDPVEPTASDPEGLGPDGEIPFPDA